MKLPLDIKVTPQTIKSINIYSEENQLSKEQVIQKALDHFFEEDYTEFLDDLYPEAILLAQQGDKISASLIQRRLEIGYSRALRMMTQLKKDKFIEND